MLARVALLALLAVGFGAAGRIVFPGPDNGYLVQARRIVQPAASPRLLTPRTNVATTGGEPTSCPDEPPEHATEDTLDRACFELTDEVEVTTLDPISLYSAVDVQCGHGFLSRGGDGKCVRWVRKARSQSPKAPKAPRAPK